MDKPRKKWRVTTTFPGDDVTIPVPSKPAMHRKVREIAADIHADETSGKYVVRVSGLTVEVNEGYRWELFETFTRDELAALANQT